MQQRVAVGKRVWGPAPDAAPASKPSAPILDLGGQQTEPNQPAPAPRACYPI